ncbi:MAG: ATP-binding protein [Verrucomicrobia bacterium]|nr:ATP-binding protein [Verrucomicrobiota bacterium]
MKKTFNTIGPLRQDPKGRFFNIAGPCIPGQHYMLPAQERCSDLNPLIERGLYFMIHAARQSGKTTLLRNLAETVNRSGKYHALYCSLESVQAIEDPEKGIPAIMEAIGFVVRRDSAMKGIDFLEGPRMGAYTVVLKDRLALLCERLDRPLVLLLDEVDCLSAGTLISFLRQLRDGHNSRSTVPFVHSLALVGMRNIRDYKARVRPEQESLGGASPFNVISESLTLRNFTAEETAELYHQHTAETKQRFAAGAIKRVAEQTCGQPWLVNAIARECVEKLLKNDFSQTVTVALVDQAIQNIILRRDTHIDSLLERLKERRVRRIIEPIVTGQTAAIKRASDDYQYVKDLGLIRDDRKKVEPANPIYGEVIVRTLSADLQSSLEAPIYPYALARYRAVHGLNMKLLLEDFQRFWRENSAIWKRKFDYKEAAPHLILMAFLQRIINGGGNLRREMAAETRRLDLCVEIDNQRYPIELKIRQNANTMQEGIGQLLRYMESPAVSEGWLLIFDRRPKMSWEQKLFTKDVKHQSKAIHILGC